MDQNVFLKGRWPYVMNANGKTISVTNWDPTVGHTEALS